jgi:hypothetical protein
MAGEENLVTDVMSRLGDIVRRLDVKEIRDEAQAREIKTFIQTEVAAIQKDMGRVEQRMVDLEDEVARSRAEITADIRVNYVPISRFGPLEKVFWAVVIAVLLGLVGGAIAILTGQNAVA